MKDSKNFARRMAESVVTEYAAMLERFLKSLGINDENAMHGEFRETLGDPHIMTVWFRGRHIGTVATVIEDNQIKWSCYPSTEFNDPQ